MPKLNQIIAVANGKKSQTQSELTRIYHALQKSALLDGIVLIQVRWNRPV
jgi:hypothetical protein